MEYNLQSSGKQNFNSELSKIKLFYKWEQIKIYFKMRVYCQDSSGSRKKGNDSRRMI